MLSISVATNKFEFNTGAHKRPSTNFENYVHSRTYGAMLQMVAEEL